MDTALHISGDWAVDAQAHPYIITDKEEKQQQLYIRLSAVKGGFLYDRTLGSALAYLDISRPDAVQRAEALARQALAQEPSAEVTGVSLEEDMLIVFVQMDGENYEIPVRREVTA